MAKRQRKNRQKGLVDYAVTFAECRESGHWWQYDRWDAVEHAIQYFCTRGCATQRICKYDPATMKRIQPSRYKYPSGYLMNDITRLDAAVECRKLLERLVGSHGIGFLRRERGTRGLRPVATKEPAAKSE